LDNSKWFDIKLLVDINAITQFNTDIMSSHPFAKKLGEVLNKLQLSSEKILHLGRKLGPKILELLNENSTNFAIAPYPIFRCVLSVTLATKNPSSRDKRWMVLASMCAVSMDTIGPPSLPPTTCTLVSLPLKPPSFSPPEKSLECEAASRWS
jgi:hypothetical protein